MGNEASTPSDAEGDFHEHNHRHSPHHHRQHSGDDDVHEHDHLNVSFRTRGALGSLRASVAAAATDGSSSSSFVDPVLSAAAAGAAARKTKHRKHSHSNPFRQLSEESNNNEWKKSLQRLAKTAASTASNAALVTAPILADAGSIVVESAKEFATDVQDEFSKPKYSYPDDEAESVIMFPYSPGRSWSGRSWYSPFRAYDTDLSPTTPNTGQSDSMGRVQIDLKVKNNVPVSQNLNQKPATSERKEENAPMQEQEREPKDISRRSVRIVHFPELEKLHKIEKSKRDDNSVLEETIPQPQGPLSDDEPKLSSVIDHQNDEAEISKEPDGVHTNHTIEDRLDMENEITTRSPKSEGNETQEVEEIEFTLLPDTEVTTAGTHNEKAKAEQDDSKETRFSSQNDSARDEHTRESLAESDETEFALLSVKNEEVERTEDSVLKKSIDEKETLEEIGVLEIVELDENEVASLSDRDKDEYVYTADDFALEETEETLEEKVSGAKNDVQDYRRLNESSSGENDDMKDLFDEFQQLIESAAKEGVFFSLDDQDSLEDLDFKVENAEVEPELEESSNPLEKALDEAMKPLERALEEASKPLEEEHGPPTKLPFLTRTESEGGDEEAIFNVDDHDDDDDFPRIINEVSTDSDMPIGETNSPSMKNKEMFSRMSSFYGGEQELRDFIERFENGEVVDEDRLYELELFERYHSGEILTSDELEDLDALLQSRSDAITTDEKTNRDGKLTSPPSLNANATDGHGDDGCERNRSSMESRLQPSFDETSDACDSTRTNETEKLTTATQSETENPWMYWSIGQKGSESSQLSTDKLASILSTSDAETMPTRKRDNGDRLFEHGNVSDVDEGWRYWASVEGKMGGNNECGTAETPQVSLAMFNETSQTIASTPTPVDGAEWVYWSLMPKPQVGQAEVTLNTSIAKSALESRNDSTLQGMVVPNNEIRNRISNPESGWLYWVRLGKPEATNQEFFDLQRSQTEEESHIKEKYNLSGIQPQGDVEQLIEDSSTELQQFLEKTPLGHATLAAASEPQNDVGQSSARAVQNGKEDARLAEPLSLLTNSAFREVESGWAFWSMLDERYTKSLVQSGKPSAEWQTTASQEVRLERNRVEVPVEQTDKPGWFHWAQFDHGKTSASKPSGHESTSALQQVESPTSALPMKESFDTGWMYWSALGEDTVKKEGKSAWEFDHIKSADEVHIITNREKVRLGDYDEPEWLHLAQFKQPEAKNSNQSDDDSFFRKSDGTTHSTSDSTLPVVGSHGWLYWSTLGKGETKIGGSNISLTLDFARASDIPEVRLPQPKTVVINQQAGEPGWLHWARFGELKASVPTVPEQGDLVSMDEEENSIDQNRNGMDRPFEVSGWFYWSTMGDCDIRHDANYRCSESQHSTASQEVQLRADMTKESIQNASSPGWLYWAVTGMHDATGPLLLDRDSSLAAQDELSRPFQDPYEDQTLSKTIHRTEKEVESEEISVAKVVICGMKTTSQATKQFNDEGPAGELHTSYNPVVHQSEDNHLDEELSATVQRDGKVDDEVLNAKKFLSNSDVLNAKHRKNGDSANDRWLQQQKNDGNSNGSLVRVAEMDSDVNNVDGDQASQLNQNSSGKIETGNVNNMPSSLQDVVGIFTKLSVESKKVVKNWHGINQGEDQERRTRSEPPESREGADIWQNAERFAKVASDLTDDVLRNRAFGLFAQINKSGEQGGSIAGRQKFSETRADVEFGTRVQRQPSSSDFAVNFFNNSKGALGAAVSKLNVDLLEKQKQKQKQRSIAIPDSIFKYDKSVMSQSSLSTVISVPTEDYERDSDEESSENVVASPWDLMPPKREVQLEQNMLQLTENKAVSDSSALRDEFPTRKQPRDGTKTKEIDTTNNYGGVDSEVFSPMLSPKGRRSKRLSRNHMKLQSSEFDESSISRLELEIESADSSVVGGSSSPNEVKSFDKPNDPESLGLALVSVSSIDSIDFLKKIPQEQIEGGSSLFWRLLIANWTHSQIWKSMIGQSLSLEDRWIDRDTIFDEDRDSTNSSSTIRFQVRNKPVQFFASEYQQLRSSNIQSQESSTLSLLEYLCNVGPNKLPAESNNGETVLRHVVDQKDASPPDVNGLLKVAESHQQSFAKLLGEIVTFASFENGGSKIKHSLGVKHYTAIRVKADRKYDGDVLQVKDILRGQVTFPNETSLICGLFYLNRKCKNVEQKETSQFEIVRLKNYFRKTNGNVSSFKEMPTGYRHILINIRIDGKLVAELQFQLAQLFDILGPDGYRLHAEISSYLSASSPRTDGSKAASPSMACTVVNAWDIAKKILLGDHAKTSKQSTLDEVQIRSKKADIAVSAAAAARGRQEGKELSDPVRNDGKASVDIEAAAEKAQEEKNTSVGIGAAAAAAARRSMMTKFKTSSKGGSITGIADSVAEEKKGDLSLTKKQEDEEAAGGIGAAAAAAARRSMMTKFKANSKGGSITGIADSVAEEKKGDPSPTKEKDDEEAAGGIGAAAAAAARRSMMTKFKFSSKGGSITGIADSVAEEKKGDPSPTKAKEGEEAAGGIGAAAAAAARRSMMTKFKTSSKGEGIGAIAAAVADERNRGSSNGKSDRKGQGSIGGIGAAAAAAGLARSNQQSKSKLNVSEGSIAGIAAAPARDRDPNGHSNQNGESSKLTNEKPSETRASQSSEKGNPLQPRQNDPLKTKMLDARNREICLINEAIHFGIEEASSNPRNLPAFFCIYLLLLRLEEIDPDHFSKQRVDNKAPRPRMEKIKTMLLTRCLAISNQASSLGMFGWLEYGSSNVVERNPSLPIEMMQRLAFSFASSGDWNKASDILSSCVMRCKEYLPVHHPTTLCTMIDLASTFAQTSRWSEADSLMKTVSDILSEFLDQCESLFFEDLRNRFEFQRDPEKVFTLERKTSALSVLDTYATDFSSLLSRDFLVLVDPINPIKLLNHSLVADCFAVLASCNAICESGSAMEDVGSERSRRFWSLAYLHHQHALRGWTKNHSLTHPFSASAALSVARCVRELGKIDESISFLESLVECLQSSPVEDDPRLQQPVLESFSFLPPIRDSTVISVSACRRDQTIVLCLWTLAVFVAQRKPDEKGRMHALKLLHQASDILRNLLYHADSMHENTRKVCLELYTCVEEEARLLFEPLGIVHKMQSSEIKEKWRMSYESSLTSMRRKRWFQQQQLAGTLSALTHPPQQFI